MLLQARVLVIAAWFVVLAAWERIAPSAPPPPSGGPRLFRNLSLWLANTLMNPLITLPIAAAAAAFPLWTRPAVPMWAGLTVDFLLLDLWAYTWHRANHEWPLLWRFHRVHHLDQFLDTTSAVRFHPGEVAISALARTPLIVLADIPITSIAIFDTLILVSALFHHSNMKIPAGIERALRFVVVTPSHHWVHHHNIRRDTDSNYGGVFTVWDRIFSSWSPTDRTPEMSIGVEGEGDSGLLSLAMRPFRR